MISFIKSLIQLHKTQPLSTGSRPQALNTCSLPIAHPDPEGLVVEEIDMDVSRFNILYEKEVYPQFM